METVLIVAHLFIVIALIAVILLQRSEGGALGIGGGGGGGGLMSARGSANLLTRTTAILAALFFATSIGLTVLGQLNNESSSILERATEQTDGDVTVLDALNDLSGETSGDASGLDLPVPAAETPASDTPEAPSQ
ncbi:preprotein translocase subunit SecG [Maritalea porphyrae]|uniref:Protein-export membrane protein SecG n=1 Tax=Maritalea porphyrae TaxID=880732 RepID=A0ABQ5UT44_9HYPH|nr:preprotein translocase subunit SecG [Maritalea porphyrae]GLQ18465.1 preprotein translocase subunit SecG [Maritalea porphyrae]